MMRWSGLGGKASKPPAREAWIAVQSSTDHPVSANLHGQWLPGTNPASMAHLG